MLTVKRLFELLAPYRDCTEWRVVRVDAANANVVIMPIRSVDESVGSAMETMIQLAANVWQVKPESITGSRRPMQYVWPRMAVCKAALELAGFSDNRSAKYLHRCRTAIGHLCKRANEAILTDRNFAALYAKYERAVKQHLYGETEVEWQSGEH